MKKITITVLLAILCFVLLLEPLTLAWMSDNGMGSPIDISGNVHKSYFASGDGSAEDPFEIAAPVQLYYFAWLQYLGLFNVDEDENGEIDTVYHFYLSHDLDMCYESFGETVQYILPPIGTQEYPFLGTFDGKGHTVTDLIVKNVYDVNMDAPEGSTNQKDELENIEIVGFFGVVGAYNGQSAPSSVTPTVQNVALEKLTVETQTDNALIGLVAGYVNGVVNAAGVVGTATMKIGSKEALTYTDKLSDYGLVGYCTADYKDDMYVLDLSLDKLDISTPELIVPEVQGTGSSGWGGSVAMKDIFTWLSSLSNDRATANNSYAPERTDVVNLSGKRVTVNRDSDIEPKDSYTVEGFGSFVFGRDQLSMGDTVVNFLGGAQKVNEIRYSYDTSTPVPVFTIAAGGQYLSFNGSTVSSTTDASSATKWYASNNANGGSIYTVVEGNVYYLTIANNALSATMQQLPASAPAWSIVDGNLELNGQRIECTNGTWRVATPDAYLISSGNNYLSASVSGNGNNTTVSVTNQTNEDDATRWTLDLSATRTTIYTEIDGETYYVRSNNNNLEISTTSTNWNRQTSGNYYRFYATNNRYLRYNSGWSIGTGRNDTAVRDLTLIEIFSEDTAQLASAGTDSKLTYTESSKIDNSVGNGYYDTNGDLKSTGAGITYFPLSAEVKIGNNAASDSFEIKNSNTGYIIGAEWGALKTDGTFENDADGSNIRISQYAKNSMQNATQPYTMTYLTGGKFRTITSATDAAALQALGLQKYAACYNTYSTSITNYCYGLHFMEASVTEANKSKITAYLNLDKEGLKTYTDYEVPTNCIDFSLNDRGFINFVAGSYYYQGDGNNSFFSIYEIKRTDDKKTITSIKEIRRIYAILRDDDTIDTDKEYYYTYLVNGVEKDANNVTIDPSSVLTGDKGEKYIMVDGEKYVEVFDCRWITHPDTASYYGASDGPASWVKATQQNQVGRAYYFEVPVNAGEYAIGSTADRTGAYLVYLDLAANVQQFERTEISEEITEGTLDTTIPQGVDWLTAKPTGDEDDFDTLIANLDAAIDPMSSVFVSVTTAANGDIVFTKSDGTTVTVGADALSGVLPGYIGINSTLIGKVIGEEDQPLAITPGETVLIKRTTYYDYNVNTKATTVTVITEVNGVKKAPTYTTYDVNGQPVTLDVPIYPDKWINKLEDYEKLSDLIDLTAIVKWEKPTGEATPPLALDTEKTKFSAEFSRSSGAVATLSSKVYDIYLTCAENVKGDLKATLKAADVSSGITFNVYINDAKVTTLTSSTDPQTVIIDINTEAEPPAEQQ